MIKEFSGKNLRGKSFKGEDLTGANFSNTDIRGANFKEAKLIGANFSNARAGQRTISIFISDMITRFFSVLFGIFMIFSGYYQKYLTNIIQPTNFHVEPSIINGFIGYSYEYYSLTGTYLFIFFSILFLTIIIIAIKMGKFYIVLKTLGIVVSIIWLVAIPSLDILNAKKLIRWISFGDIALSGCWVISLVFACYFALIVIVTLSFNGEPFDRNLTVIYALVILLIAANLGTGGFSEECAHLSWIISVTTFLTLLTLIIYIKKRVLKKDKQFVSLRRLGIFIISLGGTNFQGADLQDADFSESNLKGARFNNSTNIKNTCWKNVKNFELANFN